VSVFAHELRNQQLMFWRNREAAVFIFVFPPMLFLLLGAVYDGDIDGVPAVDRLLVGILGYGCANTALAGLAITLVIRREDGILKRLRATPLRPVTILTAHVLVKLLLTAVTLVLMVLAGKRYYPVPVAVPVSSFMLALLLTTITILSLGFLIASLVPTARFAQPIGSAIFYPMVALSGLFVPVAALPQGFRIIARLLPLTYASSLLKGIWTGDPWSAHVLDVAVLLLMFAAYTLLSAKVFRWE
jgi:ABC-2 type transport system permease protein